jgi:hypothetical protein
MAKTGLKSNKNGIKKFQKQTIKAYLTIINAYNSLFVRTFKVNGFKINFSKLFKFLKIFRIFPKFPNFFQEFFESFTDFFQSFSYYLVIILVIIY